ncbi:MAG: serine/threonine-protein kinase [Myxococcota bacterium]
MNEPTRNSSSSPFVPRDFGPYRIVRPLGLGGMAETFEAIRRGPSGFTQRVCLKLVLPFFRNDEDFVRLFEREAKLAAKLRHRNIVGVIDFGNIDGDYYMALELVDGIDLQGLLNGQHGKRLSHEYVALIGHELALALEHAHNPPRASGFDATGPGAIIHRDISPSNVLISRQGEVFLADFGVAKAVSGASQKQSAVKGKIPYMSPEQLGAQACDGRADLFSLGVVLFQALSGEKPYDGGNDPSTIMKILNGDHPSLRGLAPSAPEGLCDVIERLIEPDIEARPQSALELLESLEEFVPAPRTQRELGKQVAKVRPERSLDELLGDAATEPGGAQDPKSEKRTSGIVGAGEGDKAYRESQAAAVSDDVLRPPAAPKEARVNRSSRIAFILGVVLAVAGAGAAGVAFWFGDRAEDAATPAVQPRQRLEVPVPIGNLVDAKVDEAQGAKSASETPERETKPVTDDSSPAVVEPQPEEESEKVAKANEETPKKAVPVRPARLTVSVFPWGYVWIDGKRKGRAPIKDLTLKPGKHKISAGKETPTVTKSIRLRPGQRELVQFDLSQ